MGTLHYGQHELPFDDRLLVHLQLVMAGKLRRQESFMMTWHTSPADGSRRVSIWVNPTIPILYSFDSDAKVSLNRTWLNAMAEAANSSAGLIVQPEPTNEFERAQDRGDLAGQRGSQRSVASSSR